jgi:hypothetical protein
MILVQGLFGQETRPFKLCLMLESIRDTDWWQLVPVLCRPPPHVLTRLLFLAEVHRSCGSCCQPQKIAS